MKSPALYLLEVLFCSGMLLAFYRLLLVRRISFAWCRRYLVAAVLLSVVIPALDIPVYPARTVVYPLPLIAAEEPAESVGLVEEPSAVADVLVAQGAQSPTPTAVDWPHVLRMGIVVLYGLTTAVTLAVLIVRLVAIRRLRRRSRLTRCENYVLAENPAVETPFSFLRTVFLGDGFDDRRREIVLSHEASHVRHRHSAERLALEAVRCLFWFNPFMWIALRWLQEVQEWEVDNDVLGAGYDLTEYRTIIFRQLFGYNPDIACGLNHSLTKNRFAMMTQFKERRFAFVRLGAAIPVVAGMMMLCSFTTRTPEPPCPETATTAAGVPTAIISGLQGLTPVPVHVWMVTTNVKPLTLDNIQYLPVDPKKYRFDKKNGKVFALNGKDISQWAWAHYYIKAVNPVFIVDGVRMDKNAYAAYSEQRRIGNVKDAPERSSRVYAGPEVAKLLGDASVDALVVIDSGDAKQPSGQPAQTSAQSSTLAPVQSAGQSAVPTFAQSVTQVSLEKSVSTVHISQVDGKPRIVFNGEPISSEELSAKIAAWRDQLDDPTSATVKLIADPQTKMGLVTDAKQELRKAKALRVSYSTADQSAQPVQRFLPPAYTPSAATLAAAPKNPAPGAKILEVTEIKIKDRNLFLVLINGSGNVLAGIQGELQFIEPAELPGLVKQFVANPSDDPKLSEKQWQEFPLADGTTGSYLVSQGVISVQTTRDTPYEKYVEVQRLITQGYDRVREDAAKNWLGASSYAVLSEADRQDIGRAVPLKISEAESRTLPVQK